MAELTLPNALFVNPTTGSVVEIRPEDAEAISQAGYAPASSQQAHKYLVGKKYGSLGQQAIAGAEGFADSATLGLSSALERGVGVPAEDMKGREEAGPGHTIGSVAGVVAPLLVSGGTSGLAKAADLTAPALLGKLGRATTGAVEGLLPEATSTLGKMAVRAAAVGAGSAAEGTFWGTGQVIHEAALGDPNLTGESAATTIIGSGLLGGALGGLFGAGEVAVPKAISAAADAGKATLDKAKDIIEEHYPKLASMLGAGPEDSIREVVANRNLLGEKAQQKLATAVSKGLQEQFESTEAALTKMGDDVKIASEGFGAAHNEYAIAAGDFKRDFAVKGEISPEKVGALFKSAVEDPKATNVMDRYFTAQKNLVDEIEKSYPVKQFDRSALESLVQKNTEMTAEAAKAARVNNLMDQFGPSGGGSLWGKIVGGHILAGGLGSTAGAAIQLVKGIRDVPGVVAKLTALERITQMVDQQIEKHMGTIVSGANKVATVGRSEALNGIPKSFASDPETAASTFSKRSDQILRLANDPEHLINALAAQTGDLHEHAPQTTAAIHSTSARAVAFLASKLPQHQQAGPLAPKWTPNQTELAKFNRYYEAVNNPVGVLKQAAAGTLTRESMEAVMQVYPHLYDQMKKSAISHLSEHTGTIPYQRRQTLSMFMGANLDGTLNPFTISRSQATLAGSAGNGPGNTPKPTATGAAKLTVSDRAILPMQRSSYRQK